MTIAEPREIRRRSIWPRLAIGLAFVAGIVVWAALTVDIRSVGSSLAHGDLWIVLLEMPALVLFVWLVRAARWYLILIALGANPSFWATYLSTAVSLGLAAITPLQAGELLKISHAKDLHGVSAFAGVGGFAAERLTDVVVLFALTVAASQFLLLPGGNIAVPAVLVACLCLAVAAGVWLGSRYFPGLMDQFALGMRVLARRPALNISVWLMTIFCWMLTAVLWRTALHGFGVDTTFTLAMLLVGVVTFAGLAVLVPGAIGVSEATVAALLVQQGFTPEQGLTGAVALRLVSFIAIGLGGIHWGWTKILRGPGR